MGILRKLQLGMLLFGVAMGFVFPLYAGFFVEYKPGLQIWFVAGCIVAGISVGVFSFALVKLLLLKHLQEFVGVCAEIQRGRFSSAVHLQSPDAIGEIATGFNSMLRAQELQRERLASGVQRLTRVTRSLEAIDQDLARSIEQQDAVIQRVAGFTRSVSGEMSEAGQGLASTAGDSASLSREAREAMSVLQEAETAMSRAAGSLEQTLGHMDELSGSSKEISGILTTIRAIAQQTNILSINATIEAARAGQHGRSFATVAGEVKKLASASAEAVEQISGIVSRLQATLAETSSGIQDHAGVTRDLRGILQRSSESMSSVMRHTEALSATLHDRSTAVNAQAAAVDSIRGSMDEMKQSSAAIQEATSSVLTQSGQVEGVADYLSGLLGAETGQGSEADSG